MELATPAGRLALTLPLPGLYNVYNAVAATALSLDLGAPLETVRTALEGFGGAFGRVETIRVAGRAVSILLVKNPAGANEVLRTLTLESGELDLWLALNDEIADGRDVSWIWDADFELLAGRVRRVTCSGTRAEEMALRLKYAGVDARADVDRELSSSLDRAVAAGRDEGRPLYALPTYTALLELRELLARRGLARRWADSVVTARPGTCSATGRWCSTGSRTPSWRPCRASAAFGAWPPTTSARSRATRCTCGAATGCGPRCTWPSWTWRPTRAPRA